MSKLVREKVKVYLRDDISFSIEHVNEGQEQVSLQAI